jgi:hypothetical protein
MIILRELKSRKMSAVQHVNLRPNVVIMVSLMRMVIIGLSKMSLALIAVVLIIKSNALLKIVHKSHAKV